MIYDSRRSGIPSPEAVIDLYLHLATAANQQRQRLQEDKYLVLAACAAQSAGYSEIAEDCRARILEHNDNHMLKEYRTMSDAMASENIVEYADQLRKIYSLEKAEYLLMKFRASGYRGQHLYGERLGIDDPKAVLRATRETLKASKKPRAANRVAKTTVSSGAVGPLAPMPLGFEPLPLDFPDDRNGFEINRTIAAAFGVGALIGLAIGMWLGSDFVIRAMEFVRRLGQ